MKDLTILKYLTKNSGGDIFYPIAEWEDTGWKKIGDNYRDSKYINTGRVFHFQHKYEINTYILANVYRNEEQFKSDNPNSLLYQIKQDPLPRILFEIVDLKSDAIYFPTKILLESNINWTSKFIYLKISEELTIGPFEIKKEDNRWCAFAQMEEDIFINCYKTRDIVDSKYFYNHDNIHFYFTTEGLPLPQKIILSNVGFVRRLLHVLQKSNIITRRERQKIADIFEIDLEMIQFLEEAFPNYKDNHDIINNRLTQVLKQSDIIETLKNEILEILKNNPKINETIEHYKNEKVQEHINKKKKEVEAEVEKYNIKLQESLKKDEHQLKSIVKQIELAEEKRDALIELYEKKRIELSDYIINGEKWKNALYPHNSILSFSINNYSISFGQDDIKIVNSYSTFVEILKNIGFDDHEISNLKTTILKILNKRIFQAKTLEDLNEFESFADILGHRNGRFTIYADASWLTPGSILNQKGILGHYDFPISLFELFEVAKPLEKELLFHVEIFGANRAPIEGYFGPIIKSMLRDKKIIVDNKVHNIPSNIVFFLQFDNDEYTASISNWIKAALYCLDNIPLPKKLSNEYAFPLYIFTENKDE